MLNRDRERITVLKDFLNCADIGKVNKSKLDFCDREFILDYELIDNLFKKANIKSDSKVEKEIISLMLFYRNAHSFLIVCSKAIAYGGVDAKDEEVLKGNYNFLVKSGLENILESYFKKTSYKKLMRVINRKNSCCLG